ncbi:MAG: hypothetical protein PUB34_01735 [Clostridia bacterium]|nr:hypothetical protein [Clostridia bacterium]
MIEAPLRVQKKGMIFNMSCLCNLFDGCNLAIIIAILAILYYLCNCSDCGCGG